jgi:type VI secretion system secreted protein VgrG
LFTLTEHPRDDQNAKYLLVSATFDLESDEFREAAGKAAGPSIQYDFRAILSNKQYRPPRVAPKPFVQGPQTAIVVGPSGDDDIHTDAFGRVKVQFHWDRVGANDENSSCWIRVASIWAGNGWGAFQLPRLKQEVIVDFLEGDPDQPIITGRVHNDANKLPYVLPDNKTRSWLKSRSTTQGTDENFNEIRFEDKKGSEEVYFHAEKDFNRVVENNDTLKVGFDKKDKGDQTIEVYNNQKVTIGVQDCDDGSQTVDVWKNRTITIHEGDELLTVSKGNREVDVSKGNDTHKVSEGNRLVEVAKGNDTHNVSEGNRLVDVAKGNDTHKVEQGNREVTIGQGNDTLEVTSGNMSVKVSAGKCTIEAGTSIELKVGGSSIKIEPAKITIHSVEIAVTGDGKVQVSAPETDISGDGMVKIQGGIVKIN